MPLTPKESPKFLAITLRCLKEQTLQADELVIAADGQLSEELISVINRSKLPIVLYSQPIQKGIGATLSEVALLCRGDLIVRIDSDDLYAPEHTEVVTKAFNNEKNLGVIGCQLIEINIDKENKISARKTPTSSSIAKRWLPWRNPLNHQTVAIRRIALMQAGGYRHTPSFEDWDLWLRICSKGYKIRSLPYYNVAARVNRKHLNRRIGLNYFFSEYSFYKRQIKEKQIPIFFGLLACLIRLPWRLLPVHFIKSWMTSKLRGSPSIKSSWITKFFT